MNPIRWVRWVVYVAGRCFPTVEAFFLAGTEDRISGQWLKDAAYDREGDTL